ncbi:MAG: hypothetical protein EOT05_02010 [Candidatus Microsaccharimonas sossegonensis]|jgi:hypothetical protein|uniref:ANTAR domain-containing protein n=1 Tax=Candidatus Microsaccharimonas sossegonensis TaxID=2506948 RepID=A0A4Q0AH59_9BACT|nr:hypothetical protein [Microbacterium sp. MRS-1]RWZ78505.1 MAG: hypothetical protein EOT05_02010 [Candidatus Microsaccharimonas sossegonensis]
MSTVRESVTRLAEVVGDSMAWMRDLALGAMGSVGQRRRARIEAELDLKQEELRRTILQLATAIGMESHEARRALIRESFLASGRIPPDAEDQRPR